ncbi:MAG: hypothetical protein ACK48D_17100, partial [Pseudanabaena sp.]
ASFTITSVVLSPALATIQSRLLRSMNVTVHPYCLIGDRSLWQIAIAIAYRTEKDDIWQYRD